MIRAPWMALARWFVPAACGLMLAMPAATLPGDHVGIRRFQTPSVGPDIRLGQTFIMPVDGLHAIEIFPVSVGIPPSGDVLFELYEVGSERLATRVRNVEVPAEDLLRGSSYSFEFAPILDSKDHTYRLDLIASPADGVAFWATKGERYPGGRMHANGRERWADLAFRVHAPTLSVWGQFKALHARSPVRVYVVAAALAAFFLLVSRVLHGLTGTLSESD